MKITVIAVGKIKEKYLKDALFEYEKRLSRYCKLQIIEIPDEMTPDKAAAAIENQIRRVEGERILSRIPESSFVVTLEIKGEMLSSETFATKLKEITLNSCSHIVFVIGGSLGLHSIVSERSNYKLSFSNMTFPHQLMRVILLEQVYRCFKINANEPYHK